MSNMMNVTTPIGNLEWVIIDGEGKESLNGDMKYTATVVVTKEKAAEFEKLISKYWEENRPKSVLKPKSTGIKPHMRDTGKVDDATGKKIYEPTGDVAITFQTGTAYKDGKPKKIPVANSKGALVDLLGKKIGNGSRGLIKGVASVYEVKTPKGAITDAGVTLYLNSLQLTRFVEYIGGATFEEIVDEESDGFEAVDGAMAPISESQEETKEVRKPRL